MYSLQDIIQMTSLSERTIRRHLKDQLLTGTKVGGVWRFTKEDVANYFEGKEVQEQIRSQAGKEVLQFMNDTASKNDTSFAVIIDVLGKHYLKKKIISICNNHNKPFTMRYYKEDKKDRYVITGDIHLLHKLTTVISGGSYERTL